MEIKINIEKKHLYILLGTILLIGLVVYVNAVAVDTKVFHNIDQIDWDQQIPSIKVGKLGQGNLDPNSGYPAGWGGGLHVGDIYSEFSIGAGSGGSLNSKMDRNGNAFFLGNVGIGTDNPEAKLDVAGDIKTTQGMKGAAWVGYKWVSDMTSISCTSENTAYRRTVHEARINNGKIELRLYSLNMNEGYEGNVIYDSGWVNKQIVAGFLGGYTTSLLFASPKGDLSGSSSSTCYTSWP